MSFDKFRYMKEKELKKQKAAQKSQEQKQIQISSREAENDLNVKIGKMSKFLEEGHRIEVVMKLRGREKAMKDWSRGKMEEFMKMFPFPYKLTQNINFDGKAFSIKIEPAANQLKKQENKEA